MKRMISILMKVLISSACIFGIGAMCSENTEVPIPAFEGEPIPVTEGMRTQQPSPAANTPANQGRYVASHRIYDMNLNEEQKELYEVILNYLYSISQEDYFGTDTVQNDGKVIGEVRIDNCGLSDAEISQTWYALNEDHLELFYVISECLTRTTHPDTMILTFGCYNQYLNKSDRDKVYESLDECLTALRNDTEGMSSAETASCVCRYLSDMLEYANDECGEPLLNAETTTIGCVMQGRAVCDGYARIYAFLCNQLGVECLYATGWVEEGHHAWNYVRAGEWYAVDPTFYDCGVESALLEGESFYEHHFPDYTASSPYQGYDGIPYGNLPPKLAKEGYYEKQFTAKDTSQADDLDPSKRDDQGPFSGGNAGNAIINPGNGALAGDGSSENGKESPSDPANSDDALIGNGEANENASNGSCANASNIPSEEGRNGEMDSNDDLGNAVTDVHGTEDASSGGTQTGSTEAPQEQPGETLPNDFPIFEDTNWGWYLYYYNLACDEHDAGDLQSAITHYEECLKYYYDHGAMFNLGNACRDLGRYSEALSWYMLAYDNGDGMPAVSNALNMIQTCGLGINVRISYGHVIEGHAPVAEVYRELGQAYHLVGNEEMAAYYFSLTGA